MSPRRFVAVAYLIVLLLAACQDEPAVTTVPTAAPLPEGTTEAPGESDGPAETAATPEPTPVPATPTPSEPLAAVVNGQPIFLADYEKELARYEQAQSELGLTPGEGDPDYRRVVLDALIETELIAQAAAAQGIEITPAMIEERLVELTEVSGGADNFAAWLQTNQWSDEDFRQALRSELIVEQMVELITADVPTEVAQVRARYIQVDDPTLAQSLLEQVRNGADFALLAQQHSLDRVTGENGGDLGFFAQGSLLVPAVEEAAFALEPGGLSEVIGAPTADGSGSTYYVVQTLEKDPARTMTAEMRFTLLQERFEAWLTEQWAQADITRLAEAGG